MEDSMYSQRIAIEFGLLVVCTTACAPAAYEAELKDNSKTVICIDTAQVQNSQSAGEWVLDSLGDMFGSGIVDSMLSGMRKSVSNAEDVDMLPKGAHLLHLESANGIYTVTEPVDPYFEINRVNGYSFVVTKKFTPFDPFFVAYDSQAPYRLSYGLTPECMLLEI